MNAPLDATRDADADRMPLDAIDVSDPQALPGRHLAAVFRAAAARGPGALLPRQRLTARIGR